ncbi:MAG: zinc metalloprotease HtpX [Candidatus Bathyarchaeota archaeon]|nr:zinc metalloprotease HtpX [Candidatus Bathyarchaeota archaeon]
MVDASVSLWKLRLSMAGTIAVIIGVSTLGFTLIMSPLGVFSLFSLILVVATFNVVQWLFAPQLIKMFYGVRQLKEKEHPELHRIVEDLSHRSGIKTPTLMLSTIPIPNAFAYGSPLTGSRVAVTEGLLRELEPEEVEAVIGHELGHLRHRDVQIMMFVSFLPSLFYMLGRSTLFSRYYGGRGRRDSGGMALIGSISMFTYFFLLLFTLGLSRLREFYADQHSASVVDDGSRKLSEALAKISSSTWRAQRASSRRMGLSGFKTLFIADPDRAGQDTADLFQARHGGPDEELVGSILRRRVTGFGRFMELFSTHPNIVKRLRALKT